ncbi:MAG: Stk1 family PASTA domain-containing Ser/Thr kinase [Clostridia bacterium]|nr:Stk1 family PASTA domain-containing Ser/Thr kinase [Clostridia bacterium]
MDKYVGKRLDGRYVIQEIIGVGGMAVVYKAHDNVEDRTVAIKILKEEFTSNEEFVRRFKNESKAIAMLSHPNIVKVYDVSFGDLIQYIVMEYIEGINLKEFIESQGSLRWKDAVHFAIQILKGLQHAHDKGIVHRDIKPQNIMVLKDGAIKVTDFGIARFARSEQRTITDKAIGSVHYISPEQARGERTDEKADVYSVGVMMYEMLTGQLPFEADSAVSVAIMQLQREPKLPTEINGSIPLGLEQITMHAMQKSVERRYQSAAEMLCDLEDFRKDPAKTFEYSYFVDDSPTRYVEEIPSGRGGDEETYSEAPAKEKNNMIPVLAGVAATLLITLVILGVIFGRKMISGTGEEIACPKFIGMTIDELHHNADYNKNFKFKEEWDFNENYEYGYICEQSMPEGKKLKRGAEITITISSGQSSVQVPDVSGKTESYAKSLLESQKFKVTIVEMASDDVEKGLVVKTDPLRTTRVPKESEVKVYISSGKATKYVTVPDVVGLNEERAKSDLAKENLVAQVETVDIGANDKYYEKGYIISQEPKSSAEKVAEGTVVKLKVSSGNVKYSFDVKVILPKDSRIETGTVSLWVNGSLFAESEKIEINSGNTYTFKGLQYVETEDPKKADGYMTATVKFSADSSKYYKYQDIEFNYRTNRTERSPLNQYPDYKKLVEDGNEQP